MVRSGLVGLLVAVGFMAASCGDDVADPPSDPISELSHHDGEFCPPVLPRAPRDTHGFGDDRSATAQPSLWEPQEAWICRYDAKQVDVDENGAWFEWVRRGTPRRLDAGELAAFSSFIEELEPPAKSGACTADLGPRYLVSYVHDDDLTGVVLDDYGCGDIRLTDNPHTTVPGDPTQPGTVTGTLSGPTHKLGEQLSIG